MSIEELLAAALKLPENDRARLAGQLLHSIEGADADEDEAWEAELKRRIDDVDSGRVKTVPWSEVKAKAEALIAKSRGR